MLVLFCCLPYEQVVNAFLSRVIGVSLRLRILPQIEIKNTVDM